jgi:uncharacterized metal-binding protein YceD (DUF177 family)
MFFVMNPLDAFTIPVKGLKNGIHLFEFSLDKAFFLKINETFDLRPSLSSNVTFDKRESMYILDIEINGYILEDCDRCLNEIPVPVDSEHRLYIKRGAGEDEADIVYLEDFDDQLNIAKYIYDFAILSLPIKNVIEDCEEMEKPFCNFEMLDKWEENSGVEDEENDKSAGNIWDELSNLKFD